MDFKLSDMSHEGLHMFMASRASSSTCWSQLTAEFNLIY